MFNLKLPCFNMCRQPFEACANVGCRIVNISSINGGKGSSGRGKLRLLPGRLFTLHQIDRTEGARKGVDRKLDSPGLTSDFPNGARKCLTNTGKYCCGHSGEAALDSQDDIARGGWPFDADDAAL